MVIESAAENNAYAYLTDRGEQRVVFIDDVESGKRGYVCIGCGQDMIAYNQGISGRQHYFGHDPKDVERKGQCTFSNETYRHKVAKDILQLIKEIRVPAVYVYPPDGNGQPRRISEARLVKAHSVGIEWVFFENPDGEISCCPKSDWADAPRCDLLIQPDVTFFDAAGKPILLIEVVVTHKIDDEKRFRLKCLGIDTISVNIPKALPAVIQDAFYSGQHTRWAYSHEQAIAQHLPVSPQSAVAIPAVDIVPGEFYEETCRCRANQINGLIRAFEKCVAGESYRRVDAHYRGEIERISANTARDSQRLRDLQRDHQAAIDLEFSDALKRLGTKEAELEQRYQSKKAELDGDRDRLAGREAGYIQRWREFLERVEDDIGRLEERIKEFGVWGSTVQQRQDALSREAGRIDEQIAAVDRQIAAAERESAAVDQRRGTLSDSYDRAAAALVAEFDRKQADAVAEADATAIRQRVDAEQAEERIRSDHQGYRAAALAAVEQRDGRGAPRVAGRIQNVLGAGRLVLAIEQEERRHASLQRARAWFKTGAWRDAIHSR